MVKLLVVDDEITSRERLIRDIMKMDFDISFIEQADDGVEAFKIASQYHPDIVITDVRMPRMNGIELSFKLRKLKADTKIIFMSGYSDKEYLKSAIQLKAISYVEKPIDYDELKNAISEAIKLTSQEQESRENAHIFERLAKNFTFLKNDMALKLINPFKLSKEQFDYTLLDLQLDSEFVTILIKLIARDGITPFGFNSSLENVINCIAKTLKSKGLTTLATVKDNDNILLHIACPPEKRYLLRRDSLAGYLSGIKDFLEHIDYFIAVGKQVSGIQNIPESYNSAVITLQRAFFEDYGVILFYGESSDPPFEFDEDLIREFKHCISQEAKNQSVAMIRKLSSDLRCDHNALVTVVKEFFYRIVIQLFELSDELDLEVFNESSDRNQLFQTIAGFYTLTEVEEFCVEKVEFFFKCRKEIRDNKGKILQIKKLIENNYMNNNLSVKMISEKTFLSLAYMCSIFKLETGKTINQYITDYRIDKAKELLKNRNITISDVAESVGFRDSQYFAKTFKKKLNYTPSEYKETCRND